MSVEIDEKIKKALVLSFKGNFTPEDDIIFEQTLEKIRNLDEYKYAELLLAKDGFEQVLKNREYARGFISRLLFEYHDPIVQFEIVVEFCTTIIKDFKCPKKKFPYSCCVLNGIAVRALLITNEILCLIKNGFASGALARWRTLYEYSVIAVFIAQNGEEYAEKYLAYEDIANYSQALTYKKHSKELCFEDMPDDELNKLKELSDKAKQKFPNLNNKEYSWASPKVTTPNFKSLAESTDINYYRPFYRFACNYNHGGVKGLFFDLGQIHGLSEEDVNKIAQTNIGFTDPAQLTMRALIDIISALLSLNIDYSSLIQLIMLKDKIPVIAETFHKVEKEIEEREVLYREMENYIPKN